jgi:hypothetical protein
METFDGVTPCNSYFSAESILPAYGVDARVCYLGVDTARFRPAAPASVPAVGSGRSAISVGRLDR